MKNLGQPVTFGQIWSNLATFGQICVMCLVFVHLTNGLEWQNLLEFFSIIHETEWSFSDQMKVFSSLLSLIKVDWEKKKGRS